MHNEILVVDKEKSEIRIFSDKWREIKKKTYQV